LVLPRHNILVDTINGDPVTINPNDVTQLMLYYFPYSPELRSLIEDILSDGDICFDLGANVGVLSVLMSNLVGSHGKVIAVDPNSRVCNQLASTKSNLDLTNIEIVVAGVSDHSGIGAVLIPKQGFSESVEVLKKEQAPDSAEVSLVTIDQLVCQYGKPRFVKVDIEGSEQYVVNSMRHLLVKEECRPMLLIEYHRRSIEARGGSVNSIRQQLSSFGYQERIVRRGDSGDYTLVSQIPAHIERENILHVTSMHLEHTPALRNKWHTNQHWVVVK
jgi:FkbM family methyltransferase